MCAGLRPPNAPVERSEHISAKTTDVLNLSDERPSPRRGPGSASLREAMAPVVAHFKPLLLDCSSPLASDRDSGVVFQIIGGMHGFI